MKQRTDGFLAHEKINHASEQFDYIVELHEYLWRIIRTQIPGASGHIRDFLDKVVDILEDENPT